MTNLSFTPSFRHRQNLDGTWDSICMRCYLTAAHTLGEKALPSAEAGHRCDEASWLFKEPLGRLLLPVNGHASRGRLSISSRTCPPSAVPRSRPAARSEFQRTDRLRPNGLPSGLRVKVAAEA